MDSTWVIGTSVDFGRSIRQEILSGGPYESPMTLYDGGTATVVCEACYRLENYDASRDGMTSGGFILSFDGDFQFSRRPNGLFELWRLSSSADAESGGFFGVC